MAELKKQTGSIIDPNKYRYGSEFYIPDLINRYYGKDPLRNSHTPVWHSFCRPFYDAAWELCRIGVLRPGMVAPNGLPEAGAAFVGDGYAVTMFGRRWIEDAVARRPPPTDLDRFTALMSQFSVFGDGFLQRASEAARCYRTGSYIACCAMAGAAAESILLAVSIAKFGHEGKALGEYRSSGGRDKCIKRIIGNVNQAARDQFDAGCRLITFWRDEAAHGMASNISEVEAHTSLGRLIRFAQFSSDHWQQLTASNLSDVP